MTHDDLVKRAARWLKNSKRCGVVLSEFHSASSEVPDAIGWVNGGKWSYLVECKTSLTDFYADGRKRAHRMRKYYAGLGRERYYLAPKGLLDAERVKRNRPGWGLLEVCGRQIRRKLKAIPFDHRSTYLEMQLIYSFARRLNEGWIAPNKT